jgi:hypothetical protein
MLLLVGGMLAVYFVQQLISSATPPLTTYVIAAIAVAMISVGLRYALKSSKKKKPEGTAT